MTVKRYFADTAREALRRVKAELGPDAIVVSNRAVEGGIEIMAMSADSLTDLSLRDTPRNRGQQSSPRLLPEHEEMLRQLKTADGQSLSEQDIKRIADVLIGWLRESTGSDGPAEAIDNLLPNANVRTDDAGGAIADLEAALCALASTQVESTAEKDHLDRSHITEALTALLTQRNDDQPFTIGLFGHWGTGKSSLVRLLTDRLRTVNGPEILVCEFNAWKNEKASSLAAVMAQAVLDKLLEDVGFLERLRLAVALAARRTHTVTRAVKADIGRWREAAQWSFVLLPPVLFLLAVISLLWLSPPLPAEWVKPVLSAVAGAVATLSSIRRFLRTNLTDWFKRIDGSGFLSTLRLPDYSSHRGLLVEIHRTLGHLCSLCLRGRTPQDGKCLLLIIDDLDRCSVSAVKEVLDAVRIVADIPRVVTLVALDERMAYAAIERHYDQFGSHGQQPSHVAREHLAKIFQVCITLPEAKQTDLERYIVNSLFAVGDSSAPNEHQSPDASLDHFDPPNEGIQIGPRQPVERGVAERDEGSGIRPFPWEIELFRDLASAYKFCNPRLLRRLHMSWRIMRTFSVRHKTTNRQLANRMRVLFWREWRLQQNRERWQALDDAVRTDGRGGTAGVSKEIAAALDDARLPSKEWHKHVAVADTVLLPSSPPPNVEKKQQRVNER